MGTDEDRAKLKALLRRRLDDRSRERLIALKMGFDESNSLTIISEATGRGRATIQRWFDLYRREGLEALITSRYSGGVPTVLHAEIESYLKQGLETGRWNTAVQAQQQLEERFKRSFNYTTVIYWLKKCAGVMRVPRPVHEKRNPQRAEAFKEHEFARQLRALSLPKGKRVRIWFADESRYGLLPVMRRCWTLKGKRPHKPYQTRYEWSYCYGALDVVEGKTVFVQTPTVNLNWTEAFLKQIKKLHPEEEHIVVWDGAGFHPQDSNHEQVPAGVHIIMLPPYSPELNPIEKLWDIIQDSTSNKLWPSIRRLDQVVALLLKDWWEDSEKVLRLVGGGWQHTQANISAG